MIFFYLLFFFISSVNASYVDVLIKFNSLLPAEKKILGVSENDVQSNKVIPYYIQNLNEYISSRKEHYLNTQKILEEYQGYIDQEKYFPFQENYMNNDKAHVDFFFKKLWNSFDRNYYPSESAIFSLLFYVHRYHQLTDSLDDALQQLSISKEANCTIQASSNKYKEELEQLNNTFEEKITEIKESNTTLEKKLQNEKLKSENRDHECTQILNNWKKFYKEQYDDLAKLCEAENLYNNNDDMLSPIPFNHLKSQIEKLKEELKKYKKTEKPLKEMPVSIPTLKKGHSPYLYFVAGMLSSFLLLKIYTYYF